MDGEFQICFYRFFCVHSLVTFKAISTRKLYKFWFLGDFLVLLHTCGIIIFIIQIDCNRCLYIYEKFKCTEYIENAHDIRKYDRFIKISICTIPRK